MSDQQPDLGALLEQAAALQEQLAQARETVIEGQAGNGMVKVEATAGLEFRSVHIDPSLAGDVEMLEDLVLAALRDAAARAEDVNQQAAGNLFG